MRPAMNRKAVRSNEVNEMNEVNEQQMSKTSETCRRQRCNRTCAPTIFRKNVPAGMLRGFDHQERRYAARLFPAPWDPRWLRGGAAEAQQILERFRRGSARPKAFRVFHRSIYQLVPGKPVAEASIAFIGGFCQSAFCPLPPFPLLFLFPFHYPY